MARGRPSKLTPELHKQFEQLLNAGAFIETACNAVGIRRQTFQDWLELGNQGRYGKYTEFADMVKKASANSELRHLQNIVNAGLPHDVIKQRQTKRKNPETGALELIEDTVEATRDFDWRASAYFLEHRHPDRYLGRQFGVKISGDPDSPVKVEAMAAVDTMTPRYMAELMAAMVDVKLLPDSLIESVIDVTPPLITNGVNGHGNK